MYYFQIWILSKLNMFITNIFKSIISLFAFYIICFSLVLGIFYLYLIYNTIITDLNLTISSILLPIMFFLYSKLSYLFISLRLEAWALIKAELDMIMLFNFFKNTLYKTDISRWLRKIIASNLVLAKYRYITISKRT